MARGPPLKVLWDSFPNHPAREWCFLDSEVVDVVAVVRRKLDEFNAKAKLKFVVTDNPRRANLMAVGESKAHCHSRTRDCWYIAFDEYAAVCEVHNSTIAAASI